MISLGELKWKESEFTQAREIYELFLEKYPDHMFASLVKNLQGECLLQEKELLEAESIFNSLLNTPQDLYIQSLVQMNLGRVIMAKGNAQKAIDLFKNFKQEKSQMLWTDVSDAFIRRHENSKSVQN
jgi:predicted negative regulator of RcsB-dependent stress response